MFLVFYIFWSGSRVLKGIYSRAGSKGVTLLPVPGTQKPDVPEKCPVIHAASPMILRHSGDVGGMKEGKIVVSSQGEPALLKPPTDRYIEPLLGAIENLPW